MLRAVILPGYETWQQDNALTVSRLLRKKTNVRDVVKIPAWHMTRRAVEAAIVEAGRGLSRDSLLLIWVSAHGYNGGACGAWSFRKYELFWHDWLARCVVEMECRVLIVNDSCFGETVVDQFVRSDAERVGIIAAAPRTEVAFTGDLLDEIHDAWGHHRTFTPVKTHTIESGGPPSLLGPPVSGIRLYHPALKAWDRFVHRIRCIVYRIACRIWPYKSRDVRSVRWGAEHDPLLWQSRRRR